MKNEKKIEAVQDILTLIDDVHQILASIRGVSRITAAIQAAAARQNVLDRSAAILNQKIITTDTGCDRAFEKALVTISMRMTASADFHKTSRRLSAAIADQIRAEAIRRWPHLRDVFEAPRPLRDDHDEKARAKVLYDARIIIDEPIDAGPDPVRDHQHIADIFNAITGRDLSSREITLVFNAAHISRRTKDPLDRSAYVDGAALTGIEYECATAEAGRS